MHRIIAMIWFCLVRGSTFIFTIKLPNWLPAILIYIPFSIRSTVVDKPLILSIRANIQSFFFLFQPLIYC